MWYIVKVNMYRRESTFFFPPFSGWARSFSHLKREQEEGQGMPADLRAWGYRVGIRRPCSTEKVTAQASNWQEVSRSRTLSSSCSLSLSLSLSLFLSLTNTSPSTLQRLLWLRQMGMLERYYQGSFGVTCYRGNTESSEPSSLVLTQVRLLVSSENTRHISTSSMPSNLYVKEAN